MIILMSACLMISTVDAQQEKTGINTDAPTEALDVNGKLRVRDLPNKLDTHTPVYADEKGILYKAKPSGSSGGSGGSGGSSGLPGLISVPREVIINVPIRSVVTKPVDPIDFEEALNALKCPLVVELINQDIKNLNRDLRVLSGNRILGSKFYPNDPNLNDDFPKAPAKCYKTVRCEVGRMDWLDICAYISNPNVVAEGWRRAETKFEIDLAEILAKEEVITSPENLIFRHNKCSDFVPRHNCTKDGIGFEQGIAVGAENPKTGWQLPNNPYVKYDEVPLSVILDMKNPENQYLNH